MNVLNILILKKSRCWPAFIYIIMFKINVPMTKDIVFVIRLIFNVDFKFLQIKLYKIASIIMTIISNKIKIIKYIIILLMLVNLRIKFKERFVIRLIIIEYLINFFSFIIYKIIPSISIVNINA